MNPNSIISFNNDSSLHSLLKADSNDLSVHDLALHAMRDRCLLFQRRIQYLEDENMRLKLAQNSVANEEGCSFQNANNGEQNVYKIAELSKQKSQLIHHIYMVTCENKNLWNKLASMKANKQDNGATHFQNRLIRSNTYITDSSPKKDAIEKLPEPSLEEISLKVIDGYIKEKSQLVEQYEEMSKLQHMNETHFNMESLGFAYLDNSHMASVDEIENEKIEALRSELVQQENDLRFLLNKLEHFKENNTCQKCEARHNKQMSSVQTQAGDSNAHWATPCESVNYIESQDHESSVIVQDVTVEEMSKNSNNLKICPMCGKIIDLSEDSFETFQKHVEDHFIGEEEMISSDNDEVGNSNKNLN